MNPKPLICLKTFLRVETKKRHPFVVSVIIVLVITAAALPAAHYSVFAAEESGSEAAAEMIATVTETPPTPVYAAAVASVVRQTEKPELTGSAVKTVSEVIPFDTVIEYSSEHYEDYDEVIAEGINGEKQITYEITPDFNGYTYHETISVNIIKPMQSEVRLRGSVKKGASLGYYAWPVDTAVITSDFGPRNVTIGSSNHKGIDLGGVYGQDIYASDGGTVIRAETLDGYGRTIVIEHDNGERTVYAHLSAYTVSVGEAVSQGDKIAEMGDSGNANGVHLHFEIRNQDNVQVNPVPLLPQE